MPTYDYQCKACGHEFEVFQSMTANRLRKCPACGKHRLERLIGAGAGVMFKGSGFYQTDYARKSSGSPKSTGTATDKSSSDSTPAKTETASSSSD